MVILMKTAHKYRAYPSKEELEILNRQMFLSKELYNLLLEKSKEYYKNTKKTLTQYRMNVWLTQIKKESPEFNEIYSQALQNVSKRISDAYKSFFRRCKEKKLGKKIQAGFPRHKKFVSSLTYPQSGFKIERKRVELSKIGRINFVNHRDIEDKIKTCSIKKTKSDEWYITFSVEKEDKPFVSNGKEKIGLDLGLTDYATLSNGQKIENPRILNKHIKRLKRKQRKISSKVKGSQNRKKAVKRFARYSEHISRIREDSLHKLSYVLVHSYSFIAHENLQIQNMQKNHRYARSIGDASWGTLISFAHYKAGSAGCETVGVNPRDSTQECSRCHNIKKGSEKLTLTDRLYHCNNCGLTMGRDENSGIVIKKRGLDKSIPTTSGQGESHAFGDIVRPQLQEADVGELGTIRGVSR